MIQYGKNYIFKAPNNKPDEINRVSLGINMGGTHIDMVYTEKKYRFVLFCFWRETEKLID